MAKGARGGKRGNTPGGFTESEGRALDWYVSGEGMWINQALRGNGEITMSDLTSDERAMMRNLDSALDKTVNSDTLYRSVDASAIFGDSIDFENLEAAIVYGDNNRFAQAAANQANQVVGKTINEKGYMSTTRSEDIAAGFGSFTGASNPIVMKIKTSKSTKGADVSNATEGIRRSERSDPQKETLLARGQSYVVEKVYSKNGQIYVDVNMK